MVIKSDQSNRIMPINPILGVLKGVLIMLFGFIWIEMYSLVSLVSYSDMRDRSYLWVGVIWGWGILGICLWRGIVAIRKRRQVRVGFMSIGMWVLGIIAVLSFYILIRLS